MVWSCALRAPTLFSERMKSTSVQKTGLLLTSYSRRGFTQDRQLRADVLFIRAQLTIRADGPPSAQAGAPQFDVSSDNQRYRQATIARCARQPRFPRG
jgi:hypothetical protein